MGLLKQSQNTQGTGWKNQKAESRANTAAIK